MKHSERARHLRRRLRLAAAAAGIFLVAAFAVVALAKTTDAVAPFTGGNDRSNSLAAAVESPPAAQVASRDSGGGGDEEEVESGGENGEGGGGLVTPPSAAATTDPAPLINQPAGDGDAAPEGGMASADAMRGRPLCDLSNFRADICDMSGDIAVDPASSTVTFLDHSAASPRNELWRIKPYPRKGDMACLAGVREIIVKSSAVKSLAPRCTVRHSVPGIVFSVRGYTGNLFHDFSDVIVPLFTTAHEFAGEVQFLVSDMQRWWTNKYHLVLGELSNYPLIDLAADAGEDAGVHCFDRVIVGTRAYKEFRIDSSKAPGNVTMVDFARFMRSAYSLTRETTTVLGEQPDAKPRLLIISRKRTRMFLNIEEIVAMGANLGYEVIIDEANVSSNITRFAATVNSADILIGVHGAGLTNCVFLPPSATLVQIVPWGGLDDIARLDFGFAESMGLRYVQYSIKVAESSLMERYPPGHRIFTDPFSFHGRGFNLVKKTFLDNQNVRLNVTRFSAVLLDALQSMAP